MKDFYVQSEEIVTHEAVLQTRFKECLWVEGTQSLHHIICISENEVSCFKISRSKKYEDCLIVKAVFLSLLNEDIIACVYDRKQ